MNVLLLLQWLHTCQSKAEKASNQTCEWEAFVRAYLHFLSLVNIKRLSHFHSLFSLIKLQPCISKPQKQITTLSLLTKTQFQYHKIVNKAGVMHICFLLKILDSLIPTVYTVCPMVTEKECQNSLQLFICHFSSIPANLLCLEDSRTDHSIEQYGLHIEQHCENIFKLHTKLKIIKTA